MYGPSQVRPSFQSPGLKCAERLVSTLSLHVGKLFSLQTSCSGDVTFVDDSSCECMLCLTFLQLNWLQKLMLQYDLDQQ